MDALIWLGDFERTDGSRVAGRCVRDGGDKHLFRRDAFQWFEEYQVMTNSKPVSGANDRPKDGTIAQTGEGLPDDSSKPVDIDDEEAARFEQIIRGMGNPMPAGPELPYDVEHAEGAGDADEADQPAEERLKEEVQREIEGPLKGSA